jgi:hypothetical protein
LQSLNRAGRTKDGFQSWSGGEKFLVELWHSPSRKNDICLFDFSLVVSHETIDPIGMKANLSAKLLAEGNRIGLRQMLSASKQNSVGKINSFHLSTAPFYSILKSQSEW